MATLRIIILVAACVFMVTLVAINWEHTSLVLTASGSSSTEHNVATAITASTGSNAGASLNKDKKEWKEWKLPTRSVHNFNKHLPVDLSRVDVNDGKSTANLEALDKAEVRSKTTGKVDVVKQDQDQGVDKILENSAQWAKRLSLTKKAQEGASLQGLDLSVIGTGNKNGHSLDAEAQDTQQALHAAAKTSIALVALCRDSASFDRWLHHYLS